MKYVVDVSNTSNKCVLYLSFHPTLLKADKPIPNDHTFKLKNSKVN